MEKLQEVIYSSKSISDNNLNSIRKRFFNRPLFDKCLWL